MGRRKLTRRQFVSTVTIGAGTVMIGKVAIATPSAVSGISTGPLQYVSLGKSGLKSTLLGMGTGFSGDTCSSNLTRTGVAESLIKHAYDKGIRFFDCADSYGTHTYTAAALKHVPRESYVLSTKIWVGQGAIQEPDRPDADVVVERFRKELNTDYIDIVQIHCMTDERWTDKQKKQMDILENLKAKNIIRAHGVSIHSLEAMENCIGNPWIDIVHVRVNPYGEAMDNRDPSLVATVIEKLHHEGKGIIGMKLTGAGKDKNDAGKIDASLKYVFGLGTVDMVIVGFEQPGQIDDYLLRLKNSLKTIV
jgi:predicted aldo/keto reductase-like oxidoreductase